MPAVLGTFSEKQLTIRCATNGRLTAEVDLRLPTGARPKEVYTDTGNCVRFIAACQYGYRITELVHERFGGLQCRIPLHDWSNAPHKNNFPLNASVLVARQSETLRHVVGCEVILVRRLGRSLMKDNQWQALAIPAVPKKKLEGGWFCLDCSRSVRNEETCPATHAVAFIRYLPRDPSMN
jgi:hypothetical protein